MIKGEKRVSIRDLADRMGVSPTAISLALNDSPRISEEMREKIKFTAKRMNYYRNSLVDTIINGTSNEIGIIVSRLSERFQGDMCDHLIDSAYDAGFFCMLYSHHLEAEREKEFIQSGIEKRLAGFIIFPTRDQANDENLWQLKEMGIPFVLMDTTMPGLACNCVISNDREGALRMTSHLLELGHRQILHVSGDLGQFSARERIAGFNNALKSSGINVSPGMIFNFSYKSKEMELLRGSLKKHIERFKPTAIFCGSDHIAEFVSRMLSDMELKVPGDVSIAGYGRVEDYIMGNIRLTTVDQNIEQMSASAIEILTKDIAAKRKGKPVNKGVVRTLKTEIFEGESCRKV
ncbi:MAG: LacI family DNA-binding transcriptional regulator [Victivallales bacterium]